MARRLSTSVRRAVNKWLGYDRTKLDSSWQIAVETFMKPGGSAEQKLSIIEEVNIMSLLSEYT